MPIHSQGYRRYGGRREPAGHAWLVIARAGIRSLLGKRGFIVLLIVSWLPFLVRTVQVYAAANLPQADFLAPDARLFRQFLDQQSVFLFFITVYAGSGLIANDRRANALQIYLSKPLTTFEYVFGKFVILISLLLFVSLIPALLLLVVQVLFTGSLSFVLRNLFLVPAITLFSLIQATAVGAAMLALSSLSKSGRYVGILYAVLIFFSQAVYGIVYAVTRDPRLSWISVPLDLSRIGDAIFGLPSRIHTPLPLAILAISMLIAVSGYVLQRRVRGVEVVA